MRTPRWGRGVGVDGPIAVAVGPLLRSVVPAVSVVGWYVSAVEVGDRTRAPPGGVDERGLTAAGSSASGSCNDGVKKEHQLRNVRPSGGSHVAFDVLALGVQGRRRARIAGAKVRHRQVRLGSLSGTPCSRRRDPSSRALHSGWRASARLHGRPAAGPTSSASSCVLRRGGRRWNHDRQLPDIRGSPMGRTIARIRRELAMRGGRH